MELVRGIPVTEYCDQNGLSTRERLELFVRVCEAVQHAHQKGIIHRDLKPAHVLVTLDDGVPVPKIIDFGIAKATKGQLTEKTLFTSFGQMIGTPLYMSPEQAEVSGVDVDTRSDIYSLGVVLYELLTGGTPFDTKRRSRGGLRRNPSHDPGGGSATSQCPDQHPGRGRKGDRSNLPERPEGCSAQIGPVPCSATTIAAHRKTDPVKLKHILRGDLDWIVMKALQKDRSRRYQTASDFVRDIERYLSDEPVEARPPTLADRVAKWARRHRPVVWSAVVISLFCLLGSLLSTLLIAGAYEEKNQQLTATEKAEQLAREQEQLAKQQEEAAKKHARARRTTVGRYRVCPLRGEHAAGCARLGERALEPLARHSSRANA